MAFCGLAVASVLVASYQLGWIQAREGHQVALAVLVVMVPLQTLAALFSLLESDTATATASGMLSATWAAESGLLLSMRVGATSDALGVLLLAAAVAIAVPVVAGLSRRVAPNLVVGATAGRFALTGLYEVTTGEVARQISAILGLGLAVLALYTALALALEQARGRTVLPL